MLGHRLSLALFASIVLTAYAQAQTTSTPAWQTAAGGMMSFDVASIHLSKPGTFTPPSFPLSSDDSFKPTGGVFHADFPLIVYIEFAYKIWIVREQIEALTAQMPKGLADENFTIDAKASIPNPTKDQMRLMVQSLLADRFKLVAHFENRETPVLAMTLDKPGKPGPTLKPHSQGPACDVSTNIYPPICGGYMMQRTQDVLAQAGSRDTTMDLIASFVGMTARLGRPVIDRTGLTGRYDFTVKFAQEPGAQAYGISTQTDGPTFLEALKEDLGLKLSATKAFIPTLIIDHVEKPTEN